MSSKSLAVPTYQWLLQYQQFSTSPRQFTEIIVKVPQMAESISEGTLSTFTKQIGDHVEQDEEIASIETDKIDVSVNAPESGTITEFLVKEGDTVIVGQELAKIKAGEGATQAKEPAKAEQPEAKKEEPKKEEAPPPPPKEEKPAPPKEEKKAAPPPPPPPSGGTKEEPQGIESPLGKGSRNENRV